MCVGGKEGKITGGVLCERSRPHLLLYSYSRAQNNQRHDHVNLGEDNGIMTVSLEMNIPFCESVLLCSRELNVGTCCGSLWQYSLLVETLFPQVDTSTVKSPVNTRSEGFLWGILPRPSCNGMFQIIISDFCCFLPTRSTTVLSYSCVLHLI